MFKPGDIVRRTDIKGRKKFIVSHTTQDFVYCRQIGGSGGLVAILPFMLKKIA